MIQEITPERTVFHTGDVVTFRFSIRREHPSGRAVVRTNLGNARLQHLEAIRRIDRNVPEVDGPWRDLPMDEAEATVLLDLGGRIDFLWDVSFKEMTVGDVSTQMFPHFFKSLTEHLKCNLHIKASGENDHHVIEGVFKAFARALRQAIVRTISTDSGIPSSKGWL